MIAMFLLFIVLSSGAVLGCFVLKKEYKFEEYAPISCMAAVLWLFCFGLAGLLKTGFWLLMAGCVAIYALAIIKGDRYGRKYFFTPGFFIMVLLFAAAVWISYGMIAHDWDEFSHWALVVKEMTMTDALPCSPAVKFTYYKSYPPAMPLFQYLVQKLNGGKYTEWLMYAAYQVFLLSFFLPFMAKLDLKKWVNWLFIPAMWLSPMLFYEKVYSTIFIDPFLGVVSGTGLAAAASENKSGLQKAFILLCISTLVLSKEVGLLLAVFLLLAYIASEKNRKTLWAAGFAAAPKLLWEAALRINRVVKPEQGTIDVKSFFAVLSGREDGYRATVYDSFKYVFRHDYLLILVILAILLFVVFLLRKNVKVYICVIGQTILYIFGMLLMYLFLFGRVEACTLASYDRYIGVVFTAMTVCLILLCIDLPVSPKIQPVPVLCSLALVLAMTPYGSLFNTISRRNTVLAHYIRDGFEEAYCTKVRQDYEPGSRVLFGKGEFATMEFFEARFILAPEYDIIWEETNE